MKSLKILFTAILFITISGFVRGQAVQMDGDNHSDPGDLYTAGRVSIGTTIINHDLYVYDSSAVAGVRIEGHTDSPQKSLLWMTSKDAGTAPNNDVDINDELGAWMSQGWDGAYFRGGAEIKMLVDSTPGTNTDMPARIEFWTAPDGETDRDLRMTIRSNGYVGIGTNNPRSLFAVAKDAHFNTTNGDFNFKIEGDTIPDLFFVHGDHNAIGIGTSTAGDLNDGYILNVNGKIRAEEVKVYLQGSWADFVFKDEFNLRTLGDVESFIKANKHLPDVPSEKEVEEDGISLGQMDAVLLQKIEELTLYIIDQEKRIAELESTMAK